MIELRWVRKKTLDSITEFEDMVVVLQYRESIGMCEKSSGVIEMAWSEWQDVPIVEEE